MSGIFPNTVDGAVAGVQTTNGLTPTNVPVNSPALYFPIACKVSLRPEVLNSLISEIECVIDNAGFKYDSGSLCNLNAAIDAKVAANTEVAQATCTATSPVNPKVGDYWMAIAASPVVLNQWSGTNWVVQQASSTPIKITVCKDCANAKIYLNCGTGWVPMSATGTGTGTVTGVPFINALSNGTGALPAVTGFGSNTANKRLLLAISYSTYHAQVAHQVNVSNGGPGGGGGNGNSGGGSYSYTVVDSPAFYASTTGATANGVGMSLLFKDAPVNGDFGFDVYELTTADISGSIAITSNGITNLNYQLFEVVNASSRTFNQTTDTAVVHKTLTVAAANNSVVVALGASKNGGSPGAAITGGTTAVATTELGGISLGSGMVQVPAATPIVPNSDVTSSAVLNHIMSTIYYT